MLAAYEDPVCIIVISLIGEETESDREDGPFLFCGYTILVFCGLSLHH